MQCHKWPIIILCENVHTFNGLFSRATWVSRHQITQPSIVTYHSESIHLDKSNTCSVKNRLYIEH